MKPSLDTLRRASINPDNDGALGTGPDLVGVDETRILAVMRIRSQVWDATRLAKHNRVAYSPRVRRVHGYAPVNLGAAG